MISDEMKSLRAMLEKPFPEESLGFRPIATNSDKTKALPSAYIDARDVAERLDDVMGVGGWEDNYVIHNASGVICYLTLHFEGRSITKSDFGTVSDQKDEGDRMKAAFSDALKRAAVKFGVGRYLYSREYEWANYDNRRMQFTEKPRLRHQKAMGGSQPSSPPPSSMPSKPATVQTPKAVEKPTTPSDKPSKEEIMALSGMVKRLAKRRDMAAKEAWTELVVSLDLSEHLTSQDLNREQFQAILAELEVLLSEDEDSGESIAP